MRKLSIYDYIAGIRIGFIIDGHASKIDFIQSIIHFFREQNV